MYNTRRRGLGTSYLAAVRWRLLNNAGSDEVERKGGTGAACAVRRDKFNTMLIVCVLERKSRARRLQQCFDFKDWCVLFLLMHVRGEGDRQ